MKKVRVLIKSREIKNTLFSFIMKKVRVLIKNREIKNSLFLKKP